MSVTPQLGFGSNVHRQPCDEKTERLSNYRIWKKLYSPVHQKNDPQDPYRVMYQHQTPDSILREQMARRMDRKVIKLEAAYGSERQFILVKRNQDLVVRDLMEDVQKVFKIPVEEQVIFHKGTNLCDFVNEKLETLGIENNHSIRVTRDPQLPLRSPRSRQTYNSLGQPNQNNNLDPVSYLKEIAPNRVPDPTPYQVQVFNQNLNNQNNKPTDVIKLYVSFGSEREYVLVHGKKPITIVDLKNELHRVFKIQPESQCIVYRGFNLHDYLDDAPLEAFGLENNSPISLWPRGSPSHQDLRLPRSGSPAPPMIADAFTPRAQFPPVTNQTAGNVTSRWNEPKNTQVLKIEVHHGSDRHQLLIKGENKNLTVLDLQNELEKLTAVPVRDQRIFFRGQELHTTPFKTLKDCELENNHSIKLVGDPSKIRYSNYFGRLNVAAVNNGSSGQASNDQSAQLLQQQFNQQNGFNQKQAQQQQQQQQQQQFQPNGINGMGYQPSSQLGNYQPSYQPTPMMMANNNNNNYQQQGYQPSSYAAQPNPTIY